MNGQARLVAFRIERRSVAVAVFHGTHLDYADARQLSSVHDKAEASALGFVGWIVQSFKVTVAVLEAFENGSEMLRAHLNSAIEQMLRQSGAAIYTVRRTDLLAAFGHPPLASRKEVRQVVTTIWPILLARRGAGIKLDAVALGLYVQTERLFVNF